MRSVSTSSRPVVSGHSTPEPRTSLAKTIGRKQSPGPVTTSEPTPCFNVVHNPIALFEEVRNTLETHRSCHGFSAVGGSAPLNQPSVEHESLLVGEVCLYELVGIVHETHDPSSCSQPPRGNWVRRYNRTDPGPHLGMG